MTLHEILTNIFLQKLHYFLSFNSFIKNIILFISLFKFLQQIEWNLFIISGLWYNCQWHFLPCWSDHNVHHLLRHLLRSRPHQRQQPKEIHEIFLRCRLRGACSSDHLCSTAVTRTRFHVVTKKRWHVRITTVTIGSTACILVVGLIAARLYFPSLLGTDILFASLSKN